MTKEEQKEKRRGYYLAKREYYLAQNKVWRDNNKEYRSEHASKAHKRRKESSPELYLWKYAKARSNFTGMDFDLGASDIVIPDVCPYFKTPFQMGDKQLAASLDRIDSSKGYTKDNIRVISFKANRMKNNATEQELISFAKGVLALHSKGVGCDASAM